MNGLILIPDTYAHIYNSIGRYLNFFELLKNRLGFKILLCQDCKIDSPEIQKADVVIVFKSPEKGRLSLMESMSKLPKSKKLIVYFTDLHGGSSDTGNPKSNIPFRNKMIKMLDRADKILCPYDYFFRKHWSQYEDKYEFFPQFITPLRYFNSLKINDKPIMKCLLTGALYPPYYPLRILIDQQKSQYVETLVHPGYAAREGTEIKVGEDYVKELHKYFCGVATPSILDYIVAKYFEIPATGSLLLAKHSPDLDKIGFIENKHYIKIDKDNFFTILSDVLENPRKYKNVREEGRKFVFENHTDENRFNQLKQIIEELCIT